MSDEIVYDKTVFPARPILETPDKGGMVYDRSLHKPVDTTQAREAGYRYGQEAIGKKQENESGEMHYDDKTSQHDLNETVYIAREADGICYPNMDPGFEKIKRSEAPAFIVGKIREAADKGESFSKTLNHFERFFDAISGEFEPTTLKQVKSLLGEGKAIRPEGRENFLKKIDDFVKGLRYEEY